MLGLNIIKVILKKYKYKTHKSNKRSKHVVKAKSEKKKIYQFNETSKKKVTTNKNMNMSLKYMIKKMIFDSFWINFGLEPIKGG